MITTLKRAWPGSKRLSAIGPKGEGKCFDRVQAIRTGKAAVKEKVQRESKTVESSDMEESELRED